MPMMHVEIEGRVQGVGFRWFVRQSAKQKGISGWVMNRPDGCVEVVARGDVSNLERFRSELRVGPPGASVTGVRELPQVPDDLQNEFIVKG